MSRRQLTAIGLGAGAVEHRLAKGGRHGHALALEGLLHHVPRHSAVFFVGHAAKGPHDAPARASRARHGVRDQPPLRRGAPRHPPTASAYVELTVPARAGAVRRSALRTVAAREVTGHTVTENDLEELLLAIIRRAGLPEPVCQHPVLGGTADFAWPAHRLIAEADGGTHDTRPGRRPRRAQ